MTNQLSLPGASAPGAEKRRHVFNFQRIIEPAAEGVRIHSVDKISIVYFLSPTKRWRFSSISRVASSTLSGPMESCHDFNTLRARSRFKLSK